jgi:hypothetical protein
MQVKVHVIPAQAGTRTNTCVIPAQAGIQLPHR